MALLFSKKAILAKIETVYGTDPVPTGAANAILARNLSITPLDASMNDRNASLPYFGVLAKVPGSAHVALEFEIEMAGSGALGTAPAWGPIMRACGMSETIAPATSVTYALISSAFESCTIYYHHDGVLHKVTGCRGKKSIELSNEGIPVFKFSMQGLYNAPTDTALPGTFTLTSWQKPLPVNKVNTTFSLHSYNAIMSSMSLDFGEEVSFKSYANTAEEVRITGRKMSGNVKIEAVPLATKDWFTIARAATTGAIAITHGVTAGNKVQISVPIVQVGNPKYSDDGGVTMIEMDLTPIVNAGNDEATIVSI